MSKSELQKTEIDPTLVGAEGEMQTPENSPVQLDIVDISNAAQIIGVVLTRSNGLFEVDDIVQISTVYQRLRNFLDSVQAAEQATQDSE